MNKQLKYFLYFGMFLFGSLFLTSIVSFFFDEETKWLWIFLAITFLVFFGLVLFAYLKFEIVEIQEDKIVILDRHRNPKKVFDKSEIEKYGLTIHSNTYILKLFIDGKKIQIGSLGNDKFDSVWEYLIANKVQRIAIKNQFVASIVFPILIVLMFGGLSFMWRQQCIDGIKDARNNIEVRGIFEAVLDHSQSKYKSITMKLTSDTTQYVFSTFYHYLVDRDFLSNVSQGDSLFLKIPLESQSNENIYPVAISDKNWIYLSADEYEEHYSHDLKYANWSWVLGFIVCIFGFLGQSYQWKKQDKLSKEKEEEYWRNKGNTV